MMTFLSAEDKKKLLGSLYCIVHIQYGPWLMSWLMKGKLHV